MKTKILYAIISIMMITIICCSCNKKETNNYKDLEVIWKSLVGDNNVEYVISQYDRESFRFKKESYYLRAEFNVKNYDIDDFAKLLKKQDFKSGNMYSSHGDFDASCFEKYNEINYDYCFRKDDKFVDYFSEYSDSSIINIYIHEDDGLCIDLQYVENTDRKNLDEQVGKYEEIDYTMTVFALGTFSIPFEIKNLYCEYDESLTPISDKSWNYEANITIDKGRYKELLGKLSEVDYISYKDLKKSEETELLKSKIDEDIEKFDDVYVAHTIRNVEDDSFKMDILKLRKEYKLLLKDESYSYVYIKQSGEKVNIKIKIKIEAM